MPHRGARKNRPGSRRRVGPVLGASEDRSLGTGPQEGPVRKSARREPGVSCGRLVEAAAGSVDDGGVHGVEDLLNVEQVEVMGTGVIGAAMQDPGRRAS